MPISGKPLANIRTFHKNIKAPQRDGSTDNAPLLLAMEVTTKCNFKCVHCSQSFTKQKPADLSLELFLDLVPLVETAYEVYLFGDGEVLLNVPRHLAMISRIHLAAPRCMLGFSTNGKLLTPEVYELYAAAGIEYIQISVDAATKQLYETMRRGGRFEELIANLDGIAAIRRRSGTTQPELRLATVISKQNYRELPGLAEFAKKYGFFYWYINAEYPHNPGRDQLCLAPEDLLELDRMRSDIVSYYSSNYSVVFDPTLSLPGNSRERLLTPLSPVFCTAPWQMFLVKANGDVKICPYFHEPVCSMGGRTFAEVWNGQEFRSVRRAFASGNDLPCYCTNCNRGIRWQFLPGYPGIPDTRLSGLPIRIIRSLYKRARSHASRKSLP